MSKVRIVLPDSHGDHIDWKAANACLADIKKLHADEVVLLGDHLDCGGTFNAHQRNYTAEMTESYEDDVREANRFLDLVQKAAPRAKYFYLEGNHEAHVERWAARNFFHKKDADMLVEHFGPEKVLGLKSRGIQYFRTSVMYMGLSIPGTIRLGQCFFTHGITAAKHAAAAHVAKFRANVVFGHCHRSQSVIERAVTSDGMGAWCPGTLAKLQPLYRHTSPTDWTHGYAVQMVAPSGKFQHINVSIVSGNSMLAESGLLGAA